MNATTITRIGLVIVALASAAGLGYLISAMLGLVDQPSVAACMLEHGPPKQPVSPPWNPPGLHWVGVQLLVCFAGFFAGNVLGHQRLDTIADARGGTVQQSAPNTVLQVAVVALFFVGSVGLGWETFAVAHDNPQWWPITWFVRCANDVYPLPTLAGALVVSTLVGHWLGFQASWRRVK